MRNKPNMTPIATMNGFSVGDRVEAFSVGNSTVRSADGRERVFDSVNATGIIVAFNPSPEPPPHQWPEVIILTDPSSFRENGYPVAYRFDQIRPEKLIEDRLWFSQSYIDLATQTIERRIHRRLARKGLAKLINLFDRETDIELVAKTALGLAIQQTRCADRFEPPVSTIFIKVGGLSFGDRVKVRDTNSSRLRWVKNCTFLCEVRGWRFFKYDHGGSHALPIESVVPDPLRSI